MNIQLLGSWKFWIIVIIIIFLILWLTIGRRTDIGEPTYPSDFLPPGGLCTDNFYENPIPNNISVLKRTTVPIRQGRGVSENMASEVFSELIQLYGGDPNNIKYNIRLPEIINPETGRRLELDCYYYDNYRKIALEYDGEQHINFPNKFHPNTTEGRKLFDSQIRRDKYKDECCINNDINLIRIPYYIDMCDFDNNSKCYKYNPKINKIERKQRLTLYIKNRLEKILK